MAFCQILNELWTFNESMPTVFERDEIEIRKSIVR